MAAKRVTQDREDLLREGVNLRVRGRLRRRLSNGPLREWVVGWRESGAGSLFVEADPVYQFNQLGEFRRLYMDGQKWSVQNRSWGQLVRRSVPNDRIQMEFKPAESDVESAIGRRWATDRLRFLEALADWETDPGITVETVNIPSEAFVERVKDWLEQIGESPRIALHPSETAVV